MSSNEILAIVALILIFFLCRELNCWYFKINDRKNQMDKIIENQEEIIELLMKSNDNESVNNPDDSADA